MITLLPPQALPDRFTIGHPDQRVDFVKICTLTPFPTPAAMAALQSDFKAGAYHQTAVDWAQDRRQAEQLAMQHTRKSGHKRFDILHVVTALHLGSGEFLTFNANQ
jgi:hypothetical protein